MAKIPEFKESQQVSSRNPRGVGVSQTNFTARAVERLGSQLTALGAEIERKQKRETDNNYLLKSIGEAERAAHDHEEQLKLSAPENGDGYFDGIEKFLNKRKTQLLKDAPSQEAAQRADGLWTNFTTSRLMHARRYQNQQRSFHFKKSFIDETDITAERLVLSPDYDRATSEVKRLSDHIEGSEAIDAQDKTIYRDKAKLGIASAYFDGLANHERYNEALARLKDKNDPLVSGFSAGQRADLISRFQRALESEKTAKKLNLSGRLADAKAHALETGRLGSPRLFADIDHVFEGAEAARHKLELIGSKAIYETMNEVKSMAAKDIPGAIQNFKSKLNSQLALEKKRTPEIGFMGDESFGKSNKARLESMLQQRIQDEIALRDRDPAKAALQISQVSQKAALAQSGDPRDVQNFAESTIDQQRKWGLQEYETKVLPRDQAKSIAQQFTQGNDLTSSFILNDMKSKYGKHFPSVLNEVIEAGKLNKGLILASYIDNPEDQAKIFSNVKNAKDIDKLFKESTSSIKVNDLRASMNEKMSDFMDVFREIAPDPTNSDQLTGFYSVIQTEAKKQINSDPSLSAKEAVNRAYELISDNYVVSNSGNSKVVIPRVAEGRAVSVPLVERFMESHLDRRAFADAGIEAPKGISKEEFYDKLESNGKWVISPDMKGVFLVLEDGRDNLVHMYDKDGNPYFRSFRELTDEADDLTLKSVKAPFSASRANIRKRALE